MAIERIGSFKLVMVRLSFVNVFEPQEGRVDKLTGIKGRDTYNLAALMDKTTDQGRLNIAIMEKAIEEAKGAKWGGDPKKWPKIKEKDLCFRDGDDENYDGYENHMYASLRNPEQPVLLDNTKDSEGKWIRLKGNEGKLYSGVWANVLGHVWAQEGENGKKVNGSLDAVQFRKHGEKFGRGQVNVEEGFDDDDVDDEAEGGGASDDDLI